MSKVFLYLAVAIALSGLGVFMVAQTMTPQDAQPLLAISLPITMLAGIVIHYLRKRSG